jgi:hypothetical protein
MRRASDSLRSARRSEEAQAPSVSPSPPPSAAPVDPTSDSDEDKEDGAFSPSSGPAGTTRSRPLAHGASTPW